MNFKYDIGDKLYNIEGEPCVVIARRATEYNKDQLDLEYCMDFGRQCLWKNEVGVFDVRPVHLA